MCHLAGRITSWVGEDRDRNRRGQISFHAEYSILTRSATECHSFPMDHVNVVIL
jgi:hypothetical protein